MLDKRITDYIEKCIKNKEFANIIIAGCSCSGKTTLTKEIEGAYKNIQMGIMHQDNYFKNLVDMPHVREGVLADDIEAFYVKEFTTDVKQLLTTGKTNTPLYDLATNTRINKESIVNKGQINIFEGLHAILALSNEDIKSLKIYLNISNEECLNRRIKRDLINWGIPENKVRDYWKRCIEPTSTRCILPQLIYANIVID